MDWRSWVFGTLGAGLPVLAMSVTDRPTFYGAGSLEGKPARKPFVVVTFGEELVDMRDGDLDLVASQYMTLWAHDDPGDYLRIDSILLACQRTLAVQVSSPGSICARWEGNSGDLSDDRYGTILRNSEYRLIGRK